LKKGVERVVKGGRKRIARNIADEKRRFRSNLLRSLEVNPV
jgi:hypothetical protein